MAATYLINRIPSKLLNYVSPFEVLFNKTPNYSFLKVFGCACYPYLGPYKKDKLSPKSTKCIFLGYNPLHKGYRCYENSISRHVVFDESVFPFCSSSSTTTITSAPQIEHIPVPVFENSYDIVTEDASENENEDLTDTNTGSDSDTLEDSNVDLPAQPPIGPSHTMVTRAKDGIVKPKHFPDFITNYFVPHPIHTAFTSIVSLPKEPKTYNSASKHDEWIDSMHKEYEALMLNNTWSLVAPTSDINILGSKWIYKLKLKPEGTIDSFKSRLVAQGCSQQDEIDYDVAFSPVVKTTTIRVVLTIALSNKWSIRQLDVSNAFLHGVLT